MIIPMHLDICNQHSGVSVVSLAPVRLIVAHIDGYRCVDGGPSVVVENVSQCPHAIPPD